MQNSIILGLRRNKCRMCAPHLTRFLSPTSVRRINLSKRFALFAHWTMQSRSPKTKRYYLYQFPRIFVLAMSACVRYIEKKFLDINYRRLYGRTICVLGVHPYIIAGIYVRRPGCSKIWRMSSCGLPWDRSGLNGSRMSNADLSRSIRSV